MKLNLKWQHEICDTDCYNEIFFSTTHEYKNATIFGRILPIHDEEFKFLAQLNIVVDNDALPVERKVNTFKEGMEWAEKAAARELPKMLNEQHYVLGFIPIHDESEPTKRKVLLIRKNHPDYQAGKLNGIGGKVEPGEDPLTAMVRECKEEVVPKEFNPEVFPLETLENPDNWNNFYNFKFKNKQTGTTGIVYCFRMTNLIPQDSIQEAILNPPTEEKLEVHYFDDIILSTINVMPNLPLIVQAMNFYGLNLPAIEAWD